MSKLIGTYEDKKHGSESFPFNIYPCTIPLDFSSVALHWQEGMEFIFIKKGSGIVQVGTDIIEAKQGDIFIIPPTILHALRSIPNQSMEYENFLFDLRLLGIHTNDKCSYDYLIPLSRGKVKMPYLIREEDPYYNHFKNCLIKTEKLCKYKNNGYELGVKANMMQFIYYLFELSNNEINSINSSKRLSKLLETIEQNYAQSFTIEDASLLCGYSSSHFMRWFKNMTGSSFTSYLNERRLVAASILLLDTNDTILSVAETVGFENLSNFNRQFKKRYGVSPRDYRISMKKQKNVVK